MNRLTLAVAGGRKTQSIVDHCVAAPKGRRILIVTYTQANQRELVSRLARFRPLAASVEVHGWFSFLLEYFVKPYLPRRFPGRRLRGLNFEGDPGQYAIGESRFLDNEGRAYKRHLAHLAVDTNAASSRSALDRLQRIYDEIHIDEVQDLNGYDLEVLTALISSSIDLYMVGDIRQALIFTNIQDPKNKQFRGVKIKQWFEKQAKGGSLEIVEQTATWRGNQSVANFADSIFNSSWGFPKTTSMNADVTGHDGVFAVAKADVDAYVSVFEPLCLRHSSASATDLALPFVNFAVAKGLGVERVLIAPTTPMTDFLRKGKPLGEMASCSLYVAVTRARASVAFVVEDPGKFALSAWET